MQGSSPHSSLHSWTTHVAQLPKDEHSSPAPPWGWSTRALGTEGQAHSSTDGRKDGKPNPGPISSQHRAGGLGPDGSNTSGIPTAVASLQQVPVLNKGQDKINLGSCTISVSTAV